MLCVVGHQEEEIPNFFALNPILREHLVGPMAQGVDRIREIGLDALQILPEFRILCFCEFY